MAVKDALELGVVRNKLGTAGVPLKLWVRGIEFMKFAAHELLFGRRKEQIARKRVSLAVPRVARSCKKPSPISSRSNNSRTLA